MKTGSNGQLKMRTDPLSTRQCELERPPDGHLACLAEAGQGARTEQFRYLLLRLFREVSALCG